MQNPPPLHSSIDPAAVWARFAAPAGLDDFCQSWLAIVCAQVLHTEAAVLLLRLNSSNELSPAATWPNPAPDLRYLVRAAERAVAARQGVVLGAADDAAPLSGQRAHVGYPIEVDGQLHGVVVLDIAPGAAAELQQGLRLLHWASAWWVAHFREQQLSERDARVSKLTIATDLLATALQDPRSGPSALAVVNELCARLHCDRVSLGIERHGSIEVKALSHTASFDAKSDLVRWIGQAMDEVLDLDVALVVPQADGDDLAAIAHVDAARKLEVQALCSVPLVDDTHGVGVITLERASGPPFSAADVELCKTVGLLLGPVFALELRNERGPLARLRDTGRQGLQAVFGPRHPAVKMLVALTAAFLLFFSLYTIEYRVTAGTVVEGEVQQAAAAPFEGYIAESRVHAGDAVTRGQVMVRLDERDLKLEQTRWLAEREQAQRKYRVALAGQDRSGMAVLAAQVNQAEAQLQLVLERLARASIVAPFDGVVVSGDLSQLLGTPVEQGKVLFEVAPRDRYRVILKVDERDIAALRVGQRGELMLSGLPGEAIKFSVKQITPVTTPQDGHNHFRVEAQLYAMSARLRPGMEGVGKVSVGSARLIWVWTHGLTDWLRLTLWNWLP